MTYSLFINGYRGKKTEREKEKKLLYAPVIQQSE
jgi:hypothetical protein